MRATPTAVQVEGSTTWYNLNPCTRVPKRRMEREKTDKQIIQEKGTRRNKRHKMKCKLKKTQKKDSQGTYRLRTLPPFPDRENGDVKSRRHSGFTWKPQSSLTLRENGNEIG